VSEIRTRYHDNNPILVGIGNPWRRDDGLGPSFVQEIQRRSIWKGEFRVVPGEMLMILDILESFCRSKEKIVFIDAYACTVNEGVPSKNAVTSYPIVLDRWQNLKSHQIWNTSMSTHGWGLAEALNMAETLGQIPEKIFILAIPGYDFNYGEGLSCPALKQLEIATEEFVKFLEKVKLDA